jgi:hypothetical protein
MDDDATGAATAGDDQQAEQLLYDAVTDSETLHGGDSDGETPERDLQAQLKHWQDMARKNERRAKENAEAAKKLAEIEESQKSEQQKLADERDRLAMQVTEYQVRETRTQAVLDAGLPGYMAEFIGAVDEETAAEQAQRLAAEVHKNNSAEAGEPHFPQGYRGRGEKRAASVASGRDLYAERHGKN